VHPQRSSDLKVIGSLGSLSKRLLYIRHPALKMAGTFLQSFTGKQCRFPESRPAPPPVLPFPDPRFQKSPFPLFALPCHQ